METSQTIGKLTVALAKAQGEIEAAKKDSLNPHFRSKYADLASVRDAIQAALSKHGIAYVQFPEGGPDTVTITTILACGDEWMRASYEMRPAKADPQGMGSAITYARRYALAAAVGVAPEDDDGNAASGRQDTNGAKIVRPTLAPSPVDKQNAAQSRADVVPEDVRCAGGPPAPFPDDVPSDPASVKKWFVGAIEAAKGNNKLLADLRDKVVSDPDLFPPDKDELRKLIQEAKARKAA